MHAVKDILANDDVGFVHLVYPRGLWRSQDGQIKSSFDADFRNSLRLID